MPFGICFQMKIEDIWLKTLPTPYSLLSTPSSLLPTLYSLLSTHSSVPPIAMPVL